MIYSLANINPRMALLDKTRLSRNTANISLSTLKQYALAALVELRMTPIVSGMAGPYRIHRELISVLSHIEFERYAWLDVKTLPPNHLVIKSLAVNTPVPEDMMLYVVSFREYVEQLRYFLTPFFIHHVSITALTLDDVIEGAVEFVMCHVYDTPVRVRPALYNYLRRARGSSVSSLGYLLDRMEVAFWLGREPEDYRLHTIDVKKGIVNVIMRKESDNA